MNYTFFVKMSCYNCVNAVIKSLMSSSKVSKVNIDFEKQLVFVDSTLKNNDILNLIETSGKKVKMIEIN